MSGAERPLVPDLTYEPMSLAEKRRLGFLVSDMIRLSFGASNVPWGQRWYDRHRNPQRGDYVIESSTLTRLLMHPRDGDEALWDGQFTRYLGPWESDGLIDYLCVHPDGSTYLWTNADLLAVPISGRLIEDP